MLVGTGGPQGYPVAGCPCARCRTAQPRRPTRVVVDGAPVLAGRGGWLGVGGGVALVSADTGLGPRLAALRRNGVVDDGTDLVAVDVDHDSPDEQTLAWWGVRLVPDGTVLDARPVPRPAGRTLVTGGARSGKSVTAERLLAAEPAVTYVATSPAPADDPEWAARVAAHRERRPAHWRTVETSDLAGLLAAEPGPLLVDCLTLWLAATMDAAGAWETPGAAEADIRSAVDGLVGAWRGYAGTAVAVTNEVGSGVVPETGSGRRFRDELGALNARIAAESERVLHVVAGRVTAL